MAERPSFVVHYSEVPEVEQHYPAPFDAEAGTVYRDLGRAAGSMRVGYGHEVLRPGRRTAFTHAHSHEEEAVYVLRGTCTLRLLWPDGRVEEHPLREGDFVAFPAGTGIAHTFWNRGEQDCGLFVIGERNPEDRVFYPEDLAYDAHLRARRPERHWDR